MGYSELDILNGAYDPALSACETKIGTWLNTQVSLINDLKAKYNAAVTELNELKADHNALLAKLDADAGVTDTNYAALHTTAAADASTSAIADVAALT